MAKDTVRWMYVEKDGIMNGSGSDDNTIVAMEINELTKCFEDFTAVDNISLTVRYGEIFGLLSLQL